MNEPGHKDQHKEDVLRDSLDMQIAQTLQERATQVHFSPLLRAQTLQRLTLRHSHALPRRSAFALAVALLLVLLVGLGLASFAWLRPTATPAITPHLSFASDGVLATPPQLAQGGRLLSLDPTARSIVYSVPDQSGVMYMANLAHPLSQNELAMRYARDVSWAPDGSALVTTIYPAGLSTPLLALVPNGQYMHLLGLSAQAAAWLPSSSTTITYVTQTQNQLTLWETSPQGISGQVMTTLHMPALAQRLDWSPDGRFLAILATSGETFSRNLLQGKSNQLYIFNLQTHTLHELVSPDQSTVGSIAWTPNGHLLTYELLSHNQTRLDTFNANTQQMSFTLTLHQDLQGMSWSPDSQTLLYSDGGVLHAHTLKGVQVDFPHLSGQATSPLWLDNQHILYLAITQQLGQLARLATTT